MRPNRTLLASVAPAALLVVAPTGAQAQSSELAAVEMLQAVGPGEPSAMDLTEGWSAQFLINTPIYDARGERVGAIENLLVGPEQQLEQVIVRIAQDWGPGAGRLGVPWGEIEVAPDEDRAHLPLREDALAQYTLVGEREFISPARSWRVTELIGDAVVLADHDAYGSVFDLIFTPEGELESVIVVPHEEPVARYADPFIGFDPRSVRHELPYTREQLRRLSPFEYTALQPPLPGVAGADLEAGHDEEQG